MRSPDGWGVGAQDSGGPRSLEALPSSFGNHPDPPAAALWAVDSTVALLSIAPGRLWSALRPVAEWGGGLPFRDLV